MRQVDDAAHARRARADRRRRRCTSATRRHDGAAARTATSPWCSSRYALYPHMTVAENIGFHLKIKKVPKPESASDVSREAAAILDLDRVPRSQAGQAVGRAAPARGDGPRHRAPAAGVPDGRAAVEPRRQAARADPHPDRRPAAAPRRDHGVRHPRPGRGDDDGRPRRRAQGRRAAAVRLAHASCSPAGQRVRRRVHRLAGDEPARPPRSTGDRRTCRHA